MLPVQTCTALSSGSTDAEEELALADLVGVLLVGCVYMCTLFFLVWYSQKEEK